MLGRGQISPRRWLPSVQRGLCRRHQSSVDDPSTSRTPRDGTRARATPSTHSAQELEPSLGNSNLLKSTREDVSLVEK